MPLGNVLDLDKLNDDQKRIAAYARAADVSALMNGHMPTSQLRMKAYWDEEAKEDEKVERGNAASYARRKALGETLSPDQEDLVRKYDYNLPVTPEAAGLSPDQQTIVNIGSNGLVQNDSVRDPDLERMVALADGDLSALNPDSTLRAAGYSPTTDPNQKYLRSLRALAARGIDVSSISPKYERETVFDEATGRERKVAVDMTDPYSMLNLGGVKAADARNLQQREIGRGGGKIVANIDPLTGQLVSTVGDVMYPEPDKPAQPSIGSVMAPIFDKVSKGLALSAGENEALKQYRRLSAMGRMEEEAVPGGYDLTAPPGSPQPAPPQQRNTLPAGVPEGSLEMAPRTPGKRLFKTPDGRFLEG